MTTPYPAYHPAYESDPRAPLRGVGARDVLFTGVSDEHLWNMAMRQGAPRFMLHDLRKMVATVGQKLGLGDAVLRRILNHIAPKTDVLNRHYVGLNNRDVATALVAIQQELDRLMTVSP